MPAAAQAGPDGANLRAPLVGRVVDRQGVGLPGICVRGFTYRGDGATVDDVTDKNGRYRLNSTSPGYPILDYTIDLRPCQTRVNVAPEYYNHGNGFEYSTPVRVRAGRTTRQDFVLRTAATIEGVVRVIGGRPWSGACVRTSQWGEHRGTGDTEQVSQAVTDDQGRYRISQLVPGGHRLVVWSSCTSGVPIAASGGAAYVAENGQPVDVTEGQTRRVDLVVVGG